MNATTTTLFQHAHVSAQMIVEPHRPRFEIVVNGEVTQTFAATRAWQREAKAAIEAARERLTLDGIELPVEVAQPRVTVARDHRMATRLHTVASSFIGQLGYSRSRQELTVVFKSGQVFIYNAVTMAEFKKLLHAHSAGKAFHAIIRGKKSGFEVAQAA